MQKLLLMLCLILFSISCRKINPAPENSLPPALSGTNVSEGIGEDSKTNPFSVENVNRAIKWLQTKNVSPSGTAREIVPEELPSVVAPLDTIAIGGGGPLQPNCLYVRFLPTDVEQLTILEDDIGFDLWDTPLHIDVANEPEFYQDPSLPSGAITWQYTVVPVGYPLPRNIQYEILSSLFLFNDDDGEPNEPEDDWAGDTGGLSRTNPNGFISVREFMQQHGNPMIQAKADLKKLAPGISSEALYKAIMILSGHKEELEEDGTLARTRYYPEGYLKVQNTTLPLIGGDGPDGTEPVKGAMVKSRNFFKLSHTYTDVNGYFKIAKGYKRKAQIVVKFKNARCAIKGITGDLKLWQFAFPVKKKLGRFSRGDMQNVRHTLYYNTDSKSNQARIWAAANALNGRWEMDAWNTQKGLPNIPYLKIWLRGDKETKSGNNTPMSNHVYNAFGGSTDCIIKRIYNDLVEVPLAAFFGELNIYGLAEWATTGNMANTWQVPAVITALNILSRKFKPDIILAYGDPGNQTIKSPLICNAMYKRLASATLYQQTGPEYWCDYTGVIKRLFTGGTNDTIKNRDWAAIVEGWGYYVANTVTAEKYYGFLVTQTNNAARIQIDQIEDFRVDNQASGGLITDNIGYRGWLACGFLYDLTDVGENISTTGIVDNANAYTPQRIFKAYTSSVRDISSLKTELLSSNAGLQTNEVNLLYTSYGY
jgi:hypothetical protein